MYILLVISLSANVILSFTAFIWRYFAKNYERLTDKLFKQVYGMDFEDYKKFFDEWN